jgi:hypothetical protein
MCLMCIFGFLHAYIKIVFNNFKIKKTLRFLLINENTKIKRD